MTETLRLPAVISGTPLFSFTTIPASELERAQGIKGPQGLSALAIADLPDDEDTDRYLALVLGHLR